MEEFALISVAVLIIGYGLVSHWLEKTVISGPMVFVGFGLLVGQAGFGFIHISPESEIINLLAEFTLVLILFTDASRIDLRLLRSEGDIPLRLLAAGLPLSMILGAVVAALIFPEFSLAEAAILSIVLSATDAALGQAVVESEEVPIRIRTAINMESGLNDGIALPFLLLFVALAGAIEDINMTYWAQFIGTQLILGPIAGVIIGYAGSKLINFGVQRGIMDSNFQRLSVLGLAWLAFSLAELAGGNGFVAVFIAGLVFGTVTSPDVCSPIRRFAEVEGSLLILLVFMLFGAVFVPELLETISVQTFVYAILSLTVIRMIPVAISLIGKKLMWETVGFIGWFGPRGAASILYIILLLESESIPHLETIISIATLVILLSVFLHGLSAIPGVRWYASTIEDMDDHDMPEMMEVQSQPTRSFS